MTRKALQHSTISSTDPGVVPQVLSYAVYRTWLTMFNPDPNKHDVGKEGRITGSVKIQSGY